MLQDSGGYVGVLLGDPGSKRNLSFLKDMAFSKARKQIPDAHSCDIFFGGVRGFQQELK